MYIHYFTSLSWQMCIFKAIPKYYKFGGRMPHFFAFIFLYTLDTFNTFRHHSFINIRWGPSPYLHSCRLGCRAAIRTRACLTASQCATIWASLHPVLLHLPAIKKQKTIPPPHELFCTIFNINSIISCGPDSHHNGISISRNLTHLYRSVVLNHSIQ